MTYDEVRAAMQAGAILVDGRSPEEFALGHLRGAINIGLEGRYAEFAGSVVKPDVDIVLMTEPGLELEGKNRLARIGFDRVIGYLDEPYQVMFANRDDVEVASRLTTKALDERIADVPELQLVDVRNPGEADGRHDPGRGQHPGRPVARPDSANSTRASRPSSTARVATGRRSPRACCGSAASPMSVMSWAATAPGTKPSRTPEHNESERT